LITRMYSRRKRERTKSTAAALASTDRDRQIGPRRNVTCGEAVGTHPFRQTGRHARPTLLAGWWDKFAHPVWLSGRIGDGDPSGSESLGRVFGAVGRHCHKGPHEIESITAEAFFVSRRVSSMLLTPKTVRSFVFRLSRNAAPARSTSAPKVGCWSHWYPDRATNG